MNTNLGPLLAANNIRKQFGRVTALDGVSLSLNSSEVVALIGSSGSGKSTLLRCLDLLEWPESGTVNYGHQLVAQFSPGAVPRIADKRGDTVSFSPSASEIRRKLGFVFQGYDLWEERTVLDNLILAPMIVTNRSRLDASAQAEVLCKRFGLIDKLSSRAWQLSGGQRQRIAIIRALMMRPDLLLLDEVTSSLDPILTYEIMNLIDELKRDGMAMLIVTHHLQFALRVSDRVIFLHDGRIVQEGTPEELVNSPATKDVERFLEVLRLTG